MPDNFEKIQDAIDAAQEGDIVTIREGRYKENLNFNGKRITIQSDFAGDVPNVSEIAATVVDGTGIPAVVKIGSGARIIGLSISGGRLGPGIRCEGGTIEFCHVYDNIVPGDSHGGGIQAEHNSIIRNSMIFGNSSRHGSGIATARDVLVENCNIFENTTFEGAGQVLCWGGGESRFFGCEISQMGNSEIIEVRSGSRLEMEDCLIEGNGLFTPFVIWESGMIELAHCTIVNPSQRRIVLASRDAFFTGSETMKFSNCIIYGYRVDRVFIEEFVGSMAYPYGDDLTLLPSGLAVADPRFNDIENGDYSLTDGSAAIGASDISLPSLPSSQHAAVPSDSVPDLGLK